MFPPRPDLVERNEGQLYVALIFYGTVAVVVLTGLLSDGSASVLKPLVALWSVVATISIGIYASETVRRQLSRLYHPLLAGLLLVPSLAGWYVAYERQMTVTKSAFVVLALVIGVLFVSIRGKTTYRYVRSRLGRNQS